MRITGNRDATQTKESCRGFRSWVLLLFLASLGGCGGSGGTASPTPPPPPPPSQPTVSVSAQPSTVTEGKPSTVTVTVTNGSLSACSVPANQGTLVMTANTGTYTAPAQVDSNLSATITCSATGSGGTGNGSATITVTAPTVAITSPAGGATVSGPSVNLTATITNPPTNAQVQFKVDGANAGQAVNVVSGSATLTWDSTSVGNGSHTITAALVGRTIVSPGVSVTVNNQQSLAINSVSPQTAYCYGGKLCGRGFVLSGSGFASGQTVSADRAEVLAAALIDSTQLNITLGWTDRTFDPGMVQITVANSSGTPSATTRIAFLGNLNTLACSTTECFQLDQGAGKVRVFSIATGAALREFVVGTLALSIDVDDLSGLVLVSHQYGGPGVYKTDGSDAGVVGFSTSPGPMGIGARGGFGCFSRNAGADLGFFDLTRFNTSLATTRAGTIGEIPIPVVMRMLGGQLVCTTFATEDMRITSVRVPQLSVHSEAPITGLRKLSQTLATGEGGWHLAAFDSGPAVGITALLHQADKTVVFLNTNTGVEMRRVTLSGIPFRIAADNVHGALVVAKADVTAGLTRFESVDPATGTVSQLQASANLLATGFGVSVDGTKVYLANRDQFQSLDIPPPPAPQITVSVSPASANLSIGESQQFSSTVTGTLSTSVNWLVNDIPGGNPTVGLITSNGLYVAPSGVPQPSTVTVKGVSVVDSTKFGTASVTIAVPPAGSPQISITPTAAQVALGSTADFDLVISGNPASLLGCIVTGAGTAQLNGTHVTFTVPLDKPSSFAALVTCTASNSAGSAAATALVNLQYPTPVISAISPDTVFCPRECTPIFTIQGSGFYEGGEIQLAPLGKFSIPAGTGPTAITLPVPFVQFVPLDQSHYSPGWFDFTVSTPSDQPGGGTSNVMTTAFLGNLNTAVLFPTFAGFPAEYSQLDQATGRLYGINGGGWSVPAGSDLILSMAVDDVTSHTRVPRVYTQSGGVFVDAYSNASPPAVSTLVSTNSSPLAVASKGGYVCFSIDQSGLIGKIDLTQSTFSSNSMAIGNTPWNVAMTMLPGNQLSCVVFNAEDLALSIVKFPEQQITRFLSLTGLTPLSKCGTGEGGWQLAVFDSGPAAGIAAVLSQKDKTLIFVDLTVGQELRRVTLMGNPFRIAVDNVNGRLVVANADLNARLTRFDSIDPTTGAVSRLNSTSGYLAVGFAVSSDGTQLFVGMRDKVVMLPKN